VHHVRQGHGRSGANRDYVIESVQALEALGYLHLIAARLKSESGPRKSEVSHHKSEAADAR